MKKIISLLICLIMSFTLVFTTACSGNDGQNGVTPKLRISQGSNEWEVSYDNGDTWTSLGVKATGATGADGATGEAGADGKDAVAPQLRINETTNEWEISYNGGTTWESLGVKATGPAGQTGATGATGATGSAGTPGTKIEIGANGNWVIDGIDTGIKASCDCNGNGSGNDEPETTEYVPITRFVVTSDVHLRENNGYQSQDRLNSVFDTAYDYASSQEDYKSLDGVFFVGDNTDNGYQVEQEAFFATIAEKTTGDTVARAVMGNHEFYATKTSAGSYSPESLAQAPLNFIEYSGYEDDDAHLVIDGFHYIFLSMDKYGTQTGPAGEYLSETKLTWLEEQLDEALEDDASGEKPIFVFQHIAPRNTVIGSEAGSDVGLKTLLAKYPNVVDFSGHTHRPITDPMCVWQGDFTAFNTGSMAYLAPTIAGHPTYASENVIEIDEYGAWVDGVNNHSVRNGIMYYICEIDANNVMRVLRYNVETESVWGEPIIIDSFGDPTGFDYTDARKNSSQAPIFDADDEITVTRNGHTRTEIAFPQATCADIVQNYRIDIYNGISLVKSEYRFSRSHVGDLSPQVMKVTLSGLQPATEYTLKVFAVNSYAKESLPLEKTFTTAVETSTLAPDVFSAQFATDGTVTDSVTGKTLTYLKSFSKASVSTDETIGKNVATFDGVNDAYEFAGLSEWTTTFNNSFTFETYLCITSTKTKNQTIIGATEEGGFSLIYTTDGKYQFNYCIDGDYKSVAYTSGIEQWLHIVATYDGSALKLYVNGTLVNTLEVSGEYQPAIISGNNMVIGADIRTNNTKIENCAYTKLTTVNLYSSALSQQQISTLYSGYNN